MLDMTEHTHTHETCNAKTNSNISHGLWLKRMCQWKFTVTCTLGVGEMLVRERLCVCKKVQEGQGKSLYLLISSVVNLNVFLKIKSNS